MQPVKIIDKDGTIIAAHTVDHPRSSYGTQIWCIYDEEPAPGPAIWRQGETERPLEIIGVIGGWLVCRQADSCLCGIIWSDGSYYADMLVDADGSHVREYREGLQVRGTIPMGELGSVVL